MTSCSSNRAGNYSTGQDLTTKRDFYLTHTDPPIDYIAESLDVLRGISLTNSDSILDVGCGAGEMVTSIRQVLGFGEDWLVLIYQERLCQLKLTKIEEGI